MIDWQPIKSAPRDGTIVLLYWGGRFEVGVGWASRHSLTGWAGQFGDLRESPSFWAPFNHPGAGEGK